MSIYCLRILGTVAQGCLFIVSCGALLCLLLVVYRYVEPLTLCQYFDLRLFLSSLLCAAFSKLPLKAIFLKIYNFIF